MKGFKDPGFQDRAAASARAKKSALEKLKAAPKPDEAELAAGAERQKAREAKAAAIIEHREKNGPFKTIDGVTAVDGIGDATLEKNRDNMTVGGKK
jgi:competence ComEA-like helix-hairpin-helix protein